MKTYLSDTKKRLEHNARVRRNKSASRARTAKMLADAKAGGCSRCPEKDPCCLDFHHEDPKIKKFALAVAAWKHTSEAKVIGELAKCVVLCANCHRKEHARLRNRATAEF